MRSVCRRSGRLIRRIDRALHTRSGHHVEVQVGRRLRREPISKHASAQSSRFTAWRREAFSGDEPKARSNKTKQSTLGAQSAFRAVRCVRLPELREEPTVFKDADWLEQRKKHIDATFSSWTTGFWRRLRTARRTRSWRSSRRATAPGRSFSACGSRRRHGAPCSVTE